MKNSISILSLSDTPELDSSISPIFYRHKIPYDATCRYSIHYLNDVYPDLSFTDFSSIRVVEHNDELFDRSEVIAEVLDELRFDLSSVPDERHQLLYWIDRSDPKNWLAVASLSYNNKASYSEVGNEQVQINALYVRKRERDQHHFEQFVGNYLGQLYARSVYYDDMGSHSNFIVTVCLDQQAIRPHAYRALKAGINSIFPSSKDDYHHPFVKVSPKLTVTVDYNVCIYVGDLSLDIKTIKVKPEIKGVDSWFKRLVLVSHQGEVIAFSLLEHLNCTTILREKIKTIKSGKENDWDVIAMHYGSLNKQMLGLVKVIAVKEAFRGKKLAQELIKFFKSEYFETPCKRIFTVLYDPKKVFSRFNPTKAESLNISGLYSQLMLDFNVPDSQIDDRDLLSFGQKIGFSDAPIATERMRIKGRYCNLVTTEYIG
ncbi:hypothetical protein VA249_43010 (plasmid) [Vibrio alfacsensis]|nr:hypothetical protein [Vibrio sp. 04Ya108]BBM67655.1 hypothetical protein VA249_43010 [Vibrio alfacsensis]